MTAPLDWTALMEIEADIRDCAGVARDAGLYRVADELDAAAGRVNAAADALARSERARKEMQS